MSNLNLKREILIDYIIFNLGSSSWMLENYLATHGKITNKMKIVNTIVGPEALHSSFDDD